MSGTATEMGPVHIEGIRTSLREIRPDDLDDTLAIVGDDTVTRWLSFDSKNREQTEAMIAGILQRAAQEPRSEYYLAVTPADSDQMIGFARLGLEGVKAANLGYSIRADLWGQGFATDVAKTMTQFGFTHLGLHRISATIGPENTASIALVERLGFTHEGRIRDHVHTNSDWRDSLLYAVLEHEWNAAKPPSSETPEE
jgi:RimJ/RimL family protein N-acetyltransferase